MSPSVPRVPKWAPLLGAAALLGGLALWRSDSATAMGALEPRSNYLVITARSGEGDAEVLWLLDTRTEELSVAGWTHDGKGIRPWGTRSLSADLEHARRQR
ncbi:MAG: hypothetical protein MK101_01440 [Phycisphaerales bacterium]|nr:hypothetical protein [Phycisphaerales bacterium]